ncbi:polysaccharide biosynthesis C-terminal domain-containing protein [Cytobacillus firmus]|uniref:murein biosynthesis integral membrane protein MurJ n=1 Tax=Cytobacillus pseudoceanisediminis TaxID=3051614 RepID=UPI0021613AA7|nr:polysaccharide biosynthesis C-terminal domain-containing protein [Cytobacillus firmus]
MSNKKNSLKQIFYMVILTFGTQICLLIINSILASQFGVSVEMDALALSNSISIFIYSFIGAGVTTILIPKLVDTSNHKAVNTFVTILYSLAFMVLLVVVLLRKPIIALVSGIDESYFLEVASILLPIILLSQYANSFLGFSNAVLQYKGNFNYPKVTTLITSLLLMILLLFYSHFNIYLYAAFTLATVVLNVGLQFYRVKKAGFYYKFSLNIKNEKFINIIKTFFPIILSTGLYQLSMVIGTAIATRLGEGQSSILNYSNSVTSMLNMLLLANIMAYLYPTLARSIELKNSQFKLFDYFLFLNVILSIIVVLFTVVGKEGITLLYERGSFSASATEIVYNCSLIIIIAFPINGMRDLIYRYFYVKGDTLTPFKNSITVSLLNIIMSLILSNFFGVYGIVLGTMITSYISLLMIIIKFIKKYGFKYNKRSFFAENSKVLIITMVSILIVGYIKKYLAVQSEVLNIMFYVPISLFIFITLLYLLKSKVFRINF